MKQHAELITMIGVYIISAVTLFTFDVMNTNAIQDSKDDGIQVSEEFERKLNEDKSHLVIPQIIVEKLDGTRHPIDEPYEPVEDDTTTETNDENIYYLGEFKLTFYCSCSICCGAWGGHTTASGTTPTANRTVAVDTSVIPFGTVLEIDGQRYIAEDTGGAIKGNRIDVYMASHEEALQAGIQYTDVYIVE